VGKLMQIGVDLGRRQRPDLKIGICGEHGGEPNSVAFCHRLGLDYVSCSPYRVTAARLAAAQEAVREKIAKRAVEVSEAPNLPGPYLKTGTDE
jgi:pyruvate, orthophosphate dikinase